ncbi:hypothetical protein ACSBR2_012219 [Camellia fascicularis]
MGLMSFKIVERWVRERMCSFVAEVAIFESHSNNGRNGCSSELLHFYFSLLKFLLRPTLLVPLPVQYGNMRLDVDDMSYEELLALGERIGNVNTGLSEDMISKCLRETKIYSDRSHEEGTLHLSYKKCNKLIAPAIAAGLGVFNAYIGHPRPYDRSKWICYNCSCNYYRNCCW